MNIEFLKYLQDNPAAKPGNIEYEGRIEPLSLSEIQQLEAIYNNGNIFPKALRELLFLAGKRCYVLTYNIFENQHELQEEPRLWLQENNKIINRPFYVIEARNIEESFLFVYLDEGDDPVVRQAYLFDRSDMQFISSLLGKKLSQLIKYRIDIKKEGYNPF
ncbi:hypothetical protein EG344_17495 [Chryseobacterium sp. G0162]|uniref:hypothetical protein n=1 Tax=Chryseobacterium TaxID=59732 RepID=UPI000F4FF7C2|nr:hypothetical protein [Chryseobacterium sp. G0162]AZB10496.1 hypothetical protein EG344_17495 [Chryseobacterium sp. G0162]